MRTVVGSPSWSSLSEPSKSPCSSTNTRRRISWCSDSSSGSRAARHATCRPSWTAAKASPGWRKGERASVPDSADIEDGELAATTRGLLAMLLEGGEGRAGATAGTPGVDLPRRETVDRQVRSDLPVDGLDVVRRRGELAAHQAARHRPQRDDEGVHPGVDGPLAAVDRHLEVLPHPEDHVRGDLAPAEDLDGALPGPEVAGNAGARLGRRHVGKDAGVERLQVHAHRVHPLLLDLLEHREVGRWLELRLHRQAAR